MKIFYLYKHYFIYNFISRISSYLYVADLSLNIWFIYLMLMRVTWNCSSHKF